MTRKQQDIISKTQICRRAHVLERRMDKSNVFRQKRFNLDAPMNIPIIILIQKKNNKTIRRRINNGAGDNWNT